MSRKYTLPLVEYNSNTRLYDEIMNDDNSDLKYIKCEVVGQMCDGRMVYESEDGEQYFRIRYSECGNGAWGSHYGFEHI